jgi:hypothetical protein
MANNNAPFGFQPYSTLTGAPWNGQTHVYALNPASTQTFHIGDAVSTLNYYVDTSTLSPNPPFYPSLGGDSNGIPIVDIYIGSTSFVRGVIVGLSKTPYLNGYNGDPDRITATPLDGKGPYYAWVVDDPNVLFLCQSDQQGPLVPSMIGKYANAITLNGLQPLNPVLSIQGISHEQIGDYPIPLEGDAVFQFQIVRLAPIVNNSFGVNALIVVRIAAHEFNLG